MYCGMIPTKNQSLSRTMRPPKVPPKSSCAWGSSGSCTYSAVLLFVGFTRSRSRGEAVRAEPEYWRLSSPLNWFDPDFVTTLTMPPRAPP